MTTTQPSGSSLAREPSNHTQGVAIAELPSTQHTAMAPLTLVEQRSTDGKQQVVAFIQREFGRVGLTMRTDYFVPESDEAAQLPLDEQPWMMRAQLGEGGVGMVHRQPSPVNSPGSPSGSTVNSL